MPRRTKLDDRLRRLCANVVAGMSHVQAALDAGYTASSSRSTHIGKLLDLPLVANEIARLRAVQAKRLNITMDALILDLWQDREACRQMGQPAAAANVTMKMATLLGFMKDKLPGDTIFINKPLGEPSKLIEMSVEEWVAEFSPKEIEHHPTNGHADDE